MVISKQCNSLERQFYEEAKVAETVYAGGKKPWVNLNFWPGMPMKMLLKVFQIYMYFLYFHGLSLTVTLFMSVHLIKSPGG